ncbi:hypothetical protein [Rhizobium esperanzae]|nr:hypothetical protein [Rhizobium esperanzae]
MPLRYPQYCDAGSGGRPPHQVTTHREYVGGTDKIDSGSTYYFKEDGSLVISRQYFNPHRLEKTTGTADVTANYSRKPDFGQYEDLIRLERS